MSRTNPYKKKKRQANRTLLVFGEGLGEKMFLRHLKKLYNFNSGVRIVVLDNDKPKEMIKARQEAKKRKIKLIENTPCLESLLLSIVDKKPIEKESSWCKKRFELKYIEKKKRGESDEYDKLFSKKLLNARRLKIIELNKLILIMEGK